MFKKLLEQNKTIQLITALIFSVVAIGFGLLVIVVFNLCFGI